MKNMRVGDRALLSAYLKKNKDLEAFFERCDFKEIDLTFLVSASSVFSSNIEGNTADLNSFMNYKMSKGKIKITKEIREIEDLVKAYKFAMNKELNETNLLKAHALLSKEFVIKSRQGRYREEAVGVFGRHGLVYLAAPPEVLEDETQKFFEDIKSLLSEELSVAEAFYFASRIHLLFAHIHPFADGNGRVARLLEKWFLSAYLGENAWKISSEEYYWNHRPEYYEKINLGVNYFELDYKKALPFLLMLPKALASE